MVVWSGVGWLGMVLVWGVMAGVLYLADLVGGKDTDLRHPWVLAISWVVTSALCWVVGRWFNSGLPIRVSALQGSLFHSYHEGHSFMLVRMEFVGLIYGTAWHLFYLLWVVSKIKGWIP